MMYRILIFLVCIASAIQLRAQVDLYDVNAIQEIEIFFGFDNWDYRLDTMYHGSESYLLADSVRINGVSYANVGVKYKGNSSYDSTYAKNPMHISLDEFVEQDYQGHSSIKLSNGYADPSLIREVLAYEIMRNYMHAPRSNFARLFVNGTYVGLYSNDEHVGKNFCEDHFQSPDGVLVKCNPVVIPGPADKSNLRYIDEDSLSYFDHYELKSNTGWTELIELCDVLTNTPSAVHEVMDVDRAIWMLAFNCALVNLDSYSGVFAQNYYLYRDTAGLFNPIMWDLNMSFGGFPFLGSGNSSMGSLGIAQMQQLPPVLHANDVYWPLLRALMQEPIYRRMYMAHLRTIVQEMIESNFYLERASFMQELIEQAVLDDANKFFTDADYYASLQSAVDIGTYDVPGIEQLMSARLEYLNAETEYAAQAPVILAQIATNESPVIGEMVSFQANVQNAQAVYLGIRSSSAQHFTRMPMWDDGMHTDGLAGDGVYGASAVIVSTSTQYYIYADGLTAGVFSPVRAEHEFHTLTAAADVMIEDEKREGLFFPNPSRGELAISIPEAEAFVLRVFDVNGRLVEATQVKQGQTYLSLNQLQEGIYTMRWNNKSQRILIQR